MYSGVLTSYSYHFGSNYVGPLATVLTTDLLGKTAARCLAFALLLHYISLVNAYLHAAQAHSGIAEPGFGFHCR